LRIEIDASESIYGYQAFRGEQEYRIRDRLLESALPDDPYGTLDLSQ
jgi:hypothetical protein